MLHVLPCARLGMLARSLAISSLLGAASAHAADIKSVTVEPAGTDVRVVVRFDGPFDAPSAFALDGPQRMVVDLPGNRTDTKAYDGQGSVRRARMAQFNDRTARLVIDLSAPMTLGDSSASPSGVLTLTLHASDNAGFKKQIARGRIKLKGAEAPAAKAEPPVLAKLEPSKQAPAKAAPQKVQPAAKPAEKAPPQLKADATPRVQAASVIPLPQRVTQPRTIAKARSGHRPLVVVDAGHGGHDPGSISTVYGNRREKDLTLAIAKAIVDEINHGGVVRAVLTRSADKYLVLRERYEIARRQKAALFISVHADSAPTPEARGATIYTLSEVASDKEAARLAAKENKSDIIAGLRFDNESPDVADILIDLAQRETMNRSAVFAAVLQREMSPKVRFKSNAHRFAGFLVLKAPDVPSVLLETGYLSNVEDAKFLFSEAGQKAIATGVRNAVEAHFLPRMVLR